MDKVWAQGDAAARLGAMCGKVHQTEEKHGVGAVTARPFASQARNTWQVTRKDDVQKENTELRRSKAAAHKR